MYILLCMLRALVAWVGLAFCGGHCWLCTYLLKVCMYSTNVYSELLFILPHSVHRSFLWTHISVQEWVKDVPSNNYVDNLPKLLFCYTSGRLIGIYCMNIHIYCS